MSTKDNTKIYSSKQEKMVADLLGWEVVSGSGAAACFPGDVIGDEWLGECKTHTEPGHKIFFSKDVWDKIKQEAVVKRRFPVLFTDDGTQKEVNTWCLCMRDRLETKVSLYVPLTKGVNKNISLDGRQLIAIVKSYIRQYPGMCPIFTATWGDDEIGICQLSAFSTLLRE